MYAIQNKETELYVTGTDFSQITDKGYKQFLCSYPMKVYEKKSDAINDFRKRKCGKEFKIVKVD